MPAGFGNQLTSDFQKHSTEIIPPRYSKISADVEFHNSFYHGIS